MQFKVGDEVKIISGPIPNKIGEIGYVLNIYPPGSTFQYRIRVGNYWSCPMYEYEVKPVLIKGQQLLFSFMD